MDPMDLDATVRPPRRLQAHNRDGAARKHLLMQKISDLVEKDESQEVDMASAYFNDMLHQSLSSVAAEFSDLDGLTWDSPEARQALHEYHAQRAVSPRPNAGGLRTRGVHARRSLSSLLSPTPSTQGSEGVSPSPNTKIAARNEATVRARRVSHDETVRAHRSSHDETVRARPESIQAHSSDETETVRRVPRPRAPSLPSGSASAAAAAPPSSRSRRVSPPAAVARANRPGRQLNTNTHENATPVVLDETVRSGSTPRIRTRVSSTPSRTSAVPQAATPLPALVPVSVPVNMSPKPRRPIAVFESAAPRPISLPPAPRTNTNHARVVLVGGKRPLSREGEGRGAPLGTGPSAGLPAQGTAGGPVTVRV